MRSTMMQMPLSLNQLLEHANALYASREVVSRRPDKSLHRCNYGAIYRRARQLAQAVQAAGVGRGDAVGTLMWNHWVHLDRQVHEDQTAPGFQGLGVAHARLRSQEHEYRCSEKSRGAGHPAARE